MQRKNEQKDRDADRDRIVRLEGEKEELRRAIHGLERQNSDLKYAVRLLSLLQNWL